MDTLIQETYATANVYENINITTIFRRFVKNVLLWDNEIYESLVNIFCSLFPGNIEIGKFGKEPSYRLTANSSRLIYIDGHNTETMMSIDELKSAIIDVMNRSLQHVLVDSRSLKYINENDEIKKIYDDYIQFVCCVPTIQSSSYISLSNLYDVNVFEDSDHAIIFF